MHRDSICSSEYTLQISRTFRQERVNLTGPSDGKCCLQQFLPPVARSAPSAQHWGSAAQFCCCWCADRFSTEREAFSAGGSSAQRPQNCHSPPPRRREWVNSDSEVFSVHPCNMGHLFNCAIFFLVFFATKGKRFLLCLKTPFTEKVFL